MDERERMREVLAEMLGWEGFGKDGQESDEVHYWRGVTEDGTPFKVYAKDWRPDERWEHCGWVIEAMRAKGWCMDTSCVEDGSVYVCFWQIAATVNGEIYASVAGDTFPEAVSLAAYRALEASDA